MEKKEMFQTTNQIGIAEKFLSETHGFIQSNQST
jgi:hypothetical protein